MTRFSRGLDGAVMAQFARQGSIPGPRNPESVAAITYRRPESGRFKSDKEQTARTAETAAALGELSLPQQADLPN